jgi:YcxB-like protein
VVALDAAVHAPCRRVARERLPGFSRADREAFALLEFACGFVGGVAVSFAMMWSRYKRLSGKVVKSDGPTMSEHHVNVAEDGIRSSSSHIDHVYRWSAFEGVTVHDGVIVLWTEPGAGALVPRSAFANPAAEAAFLEAVRGHIAAAKTSAKI